MVYVQQPPQTPQPNVVTQCIRNFPDPRYDCCKLIANYC